MAGELILIVEDNEKNRKLERDILQFHGYQTMEAETAEEGLRLAQATPPALVLMDIQLPGMNGIEALHHLRADPRTRAIPVIAVTASVMDRDRSASPVKATSSACSSCGRALLTFNLAASEIVSTTTSPLA